MRRNALLGLLLCLVVLPVAAQDPPAAGTGLPDLEELERQLEQKKTTKEAQDRKAAAARAERERRKADADAARSAQERAAGQARAEQTKKDAAEAALREEQARAAEAARVEQERLAAAAEARRQEEARAAEAARLEQAGRLEEEKRIAEMQPGRVFRDCPDCPEMVRIAAGSFRMGDLHGRGESDESPVHTVKIPAFSIGKFEVTFSQWGVCVAEGGCSHHPGDSGAQGNLPVVEVSPVDAEQYLQWLSRKTGKPYRLPSESEWEYAARAGTASEYSWGDAIGSNQANCARCGSRWDIRQTAPVGSFSPSPWGLHDLHGNVWEWTQDCWKNGYDSAPVDGSAQRSGDCGRRVMRGGSRYNDAGKLRSAARGRESAAKRSDLIGFRVVRDGY